MGAATSAEDYVFFFIFVLDVVFANGIICFVHPIVHGLFSVPAPLFGLLAGSSAGFFSCACFLRYPTVYHSRSFSVAFATAADRIWTIPHEFPSAQKLGKKKREDPQPKRADPCPDLYDLVKIGESEPQLAGERR
jgi:hypothetical protein